MKFHKVLLLGLLFCSIGSCGENGTKDYSKLVVFSENNHINAIIEIPAGTNSKIEYVKKKNQFEVDKRNWIERTINFLPYLGNYGFIPDTYSDPEIGGDADGIDILVISESVPTGTVMETIPIALLKLVDNGETDYKVIATPAAIEERVLNAVTFEEFSSKHPSVLKIIEEWFLNYDEGQTAEVEGWGDEKNAVYEITKSIFK